MTTKIHLAADQRCRPIAVLTSEGQRHDSIAFETVLGLVGIDRLGPGRPRTRPDWVLADKAYSSKANRDYLAKRGIKAAIPVKEDQATGRRRKGSAGGRPPNFDKQRYRDRNTVERTVNKLRGCRATATRYEKRNYMYLGTIAVTSIWIWLRNPTAIDIVRHALVAVVRDHLRLSRRAESYGDEVREPGWVDQQGRWSDICSSSVAPRIGDRPAGPTSPPGSAIQKTLASGSATR